MPAIDRAESAGYSGAQDRFKGGGMAAVLLELLYLFINAVDCCKLLIVNNFTDFGGPCYYARRHVIPQFCGIYQSYPS
jgi:hypothetical protein